MFTTQMKELHTHKHTRTHTQTTTTTTTIKEAKQSEIDVCCGNGESLSSMLQHCS